MLDKKIIKIFKDKLNEKVIKITDSSNGLAQIVKIVETKNKKYVFKNPKPGDGIMIYRENFVCSNLKSKFIPKVFFKTKNYLIESFLEGTRPERNKPEIFYYSLGKNIRKIHKVKMTGFGELQKNGKGQYKTAKQYIDNLIIENFPKFKNIKSFDKKILKYLEKFIYENINCFDEKNSFLLHFDLIPDNILMQDNKLAGIIDFGDANCGPVEYDFGKLYLEISDKMFTKVLEGYGKKLEMKKIQYFVVLHLLCILPYFYKVNRKRYEKSVKLLRKFSKF
ncbi:MAG: hypothetical protein ACD_18C00322G0002 [uncultured bacterium]|nr:MAG: hypothetical protein ACD_18C00322G0002 [uncultured bacterium]